jgi:hypothetical protein
MWQGKAVTQGSSTVSSIIAFENGELEHDEIIALFQHLIDTGIAWQLQGSYVRAAVRLIESGECHA